MREPLFFIALLPPEDIQQEVTNFKRDCASRFKSGHALKTSPHLTLIPPFSWPLTRLGDLGDALQNFASVQTSFEVALKDFSSFPPRVIFVDVVENGQLKTLQSGLFQHLKETVGLEDERGRHFHPHMTIAHRDLKPTVFQDAWSYFSGLGYRRSFRAEDLTLLEHVNHRWQVYEDYPFGS